MVHFGWSSEGLLCRWLVRERLIFVNDVQTL
jgi:hypothetical protein